MARLELASGSGQGPPGGRLRVYTAAGKLAASSSSPGNEEVLQYNPEHQAFVWTASAQWSLLFKAQETAMQFEGNHLVYEQKMGCILKEMEHILICSIVIQV